MHNGEQKHRPGCPGHAPTGAPKTATSTVAPSHGATGRSRTCGPLLTRQPLCLLSYGGEMAPSHARREVLTHCHGEGGGEGRWLPGAAGHGLKAGDPRAAVFDASQILTHRSHR